MFDGLDEVFSPTQREDIINDIIRFTDKYPDGNRSQAIANYKKMKPLCFQEL